MNGILLIDKPTDWTSMDVCAKLRGVFHEKRIGHSGTLDPMATGLLVVFLGRATRAVEFAEADSKEYIARLRLGITTDTQDTSGNVLSEKSADISDELLLSALEKFKGEIEQIPPMYSAIKIGGKKLYEIARKGESVERKSRKITIHSLDFLGWEDGDALLRIRCSKGTYIRTLCNDIGEALGCGGCMSSLRRSAAGIFSLSEAHRLEDVIAAGEKAEELLLPVDALFATLPSAVLNAKQEKLFRNGVRFSYSCENERFRVYSESGEFLALAAVEEGKIVCIKSFYEVK